MWVMAGIASQLLCIQCLRWARALHSVLFLLFGILLFGLSITLLAAQLGFELGLTWSLVTVSVAAYVLILCPLPVARQIGHKRVPKRTRRAPASPSGSGWRLSVRLFSAGLLYLLTALALSLIVATKPWAQEITRLFTGGLLTPLFWSIGALHATVDASLARVVWMPILLTLVGAAIHLLL